MAMDTSQNIGIGTLLPFKRLHVWTEDDENFNGGCCDEDMEHVPEPEEGI